MEFWSISDISLINLILSMSNKERELFELLIDYDNQVNRYNEALVGLEEEERWTNYYKEQLLDTSSFQATCRSLEADISLFVSQFDDLDDRLAKFKSELATSRFSCITFLKNYKISDDQLISLSKKYNFDCQDVICLDENPIYGVYQAIWNNKTKILN